MSRLLAPGPVRAATAVYTAALLTATHWPRLQIEGPVTRPDLWIHTGAFGLLTLLVICCRFFGPASSARNAFLSAGAVCLFAAFDEVTQAIPALHRTPALSDWVADAAGSLLAAAGWSIVVAPRLKRGP